MRPNSLPAKPTACPKSYHNRTAYPVFHGNLLPLHRQCKTPNTIQNLQISLVATSRGLIAVSPVAMFLALYVAVSIISGDFYRMPIAVALAAASIWSVIIYRGHTLQERIDTFSRAAGSPNIMYMIWVFILAGAFASLPRRPVGRRHGIAHPAVAFAAMVVPGLL